MFTPSMDSMRLDTFTREDERKGQLTNLATPFHSLDQQTSPADATPYSTLTSFVETTHYFETFPHHEVTNAETSPSYKDYSKEQPAFPPSASDNRSNRGGCPKVFPYRLYNMLECVEQDGYSHIVSWQQHGRCFVIRQPEAFQKVVLPRYFRFNRIQSFQRQMSFYSFQRLTAGPDRGGYYHELFLRGRPDLLDSIQRTKVKGNRVRTKSDPDKEPNFWSMPWLSNEHRVSIDTSSPATRSPQHHEAVATLQEQATMNSDSMYSHEVEGRDTVHHDSFHNVFDDIDADDDQVDRVMIEFFKQDKRTLQDVAIVEF